MIGGFEIDIFSSEEHSVESDVTEHLVESGSIMTDHVRRKPRMLSIEGVVSDTPHGDLRDRRSTDTLPSEDFRLYMDEIQGEGTQIVVITSVRVYENVVLKSFSETVNAQTGKSIRFKATFQQILIVETERASIRTAMPRAKRKVNLGNKPVKQFKISEIWGPSSATEENNSSLWRLKQGEGLSSFDHLNPF